MEAQKVDLFLLTHSKYFEGYLVPQIRERLLQMDDSKLVHVMANDFKEPAFSLVFSFMGGHFGVDRFVIGDVGLGVAKLLTCGGFGIWAIVDWFVIMGRTREINFQKLQRAIA
jgi:TM2 domain.